MSLACRSSSIMRIKIDIDSAFNVSLLNTHYYKIITMQLNVLILSASKINI